MKNKTPEPPKGEVVHFDFVNGKPIVKKRIIKKRLKKNETDN